MLRFWIAIIFILFAGEVFSQGSFDLADNKYGLDPVLYNGKKYSFYPAAGIKGHQFLQQPDFVQGELLIAGKDFKNVLLNYDVYNQLLLLKYYDELKAACIIEVSFAWLDGFTIGDRRFIVLTTSNTPTIFESIGEQGLQVLYSWTKEIRIEPATSNQAFTAASRSSFLRINEKIIDYRTKKQFLSSFDPLTRSYIQDFLHSRHIRFKQINKQQMEELILGIVKSKKL
jgi:hypothetical protein